MNTKRGLFIATSDETSSQILPTELFNELAKKSVRYLGHTFRDGSELDIAFSRRQNGPVPKLTLRLACVPAAQNKRRLARLWINDRTGQP